MNFKRLNAAIVIGFIITFAVSWVCGFMNTCSDIRENVLRIHIIANSDSEDDQQLKIKVRDAVLAQCPELFKGEENIQAAKAAAEKNLEKLEQAAKAQLQEDGKDYTVKAELTNMYFETREYENFTMPAGRYDAVRLVIGEGKGKNWWCVMFPSLCIPAADSGMQHFTKQQQELLESTPMFEPRFAVVEWWESKVKGESN